MTRKSNTTAIIQLSKENFRDGIEKKRGLVLIQLHKKQSELEWRH